MATRKSIDDKNTPRRMNLNGNAAIKFIMMVMHVNVKGEVATSCVQDDFVKNNDGYSRGVVQSSFNCLKEPGIVVNHRKGFWKFSDWYLARFQPGGPGAILPEELHKIFHMRKS